MDYKEKYEQALEVAKETYNKQPMYKDWLESMFPDLKESEDDRIRKAIIATIHLYYGEPLEDEAKDMIAWLEKQGEKKVSYTTTVETGDGGINALVTRDIEIPFGAKDSELQEATYYIPKGYYAKIEDDKVVIKKGEKKPAWSEEEEHYICQLESMVKERWALAEKAQDEEVIKNMSDLAFFLKTLNPNKKLADEEMKTLLCTEYEKGRADAIADMQMEWSEEDETTLNSILSCIKRCLDKDTVAWYLGKHLIDLKRYDPMFDWLESLKQRIGG